MWISNKNSTKGADASGEFQLAACIQLIHALTTHSAELKIKLQLMHDNRAAAVCNQEPSIDVN